jgi:hypothetical protein
VRKALLLTVVVATAGLLASIDSWARPASSAPWTGTWKRAASEIDPGGPTVFALRQVGHHLTGTFPWRGCTTQKGGSIVGWAQANRAALATRQTDGTLVVVNLHLTPDGARISGSYQITSGTCSASGPFTAIRVH